MGPERRNRSSLSMSLFIAAVSIVSFGPGWSGNNISAVHAFQNLAAVSLHRPAILQTQQFTLRSLSSNNNDNNEKKSNNNNNNNNNDNDNNDDTDPFDLDLLARRFERADKTEIRNDATLVACYVLCRFLVYDITSGAKIDPGWEVQDWIWLTGTFSSGVVLVVYYLIAGLLSRTYEANTTFAAYGPSPVIRSLINVALCCPVWLATEHLLGFGPANIGGDTLALAVTTGFVGMGSFMALAKFLTTELR